MKLNLLKKSNWVIPALGIVLVGGALAGATAYLNIERGIHSAETYGAMLDRLYCDQQVSIVLRKLHDGDVGLATQKLDMMLCGEVIKIDSQLASVDERARKFALDSFRRIAHFRPRVSETSPEGTSHPRCDDQLTAQKILALAAADERAAR